MDLREQKYVCTLAELGNLTRAAERLYISQPALSIYITNLEKNLGTPLFDRSGKKFTLTYAGEQYVKRAEKMLELEREFNEEIEKISRETAGRIRLGISQRRGCFFLPPVIAEYERRWPEIDLVIREGNLTDLGEMFKNGELDMIVLNRIDVKENMDTELLFREEFLAAVPVCHEINEKSEYGARKPFPKAQAGVSEWGSSDLTYSLAEQQKDRGRDPETTWRDARESPCNSQHGDRGPDGGGRSWDHLYPGSVCGEFPLPEAGELLYSGYRTP